MPASFEPIINKESEMLILGSLPSVISLREEQYYANPRNQFWDIIFSVFDSEISYDYNLRKEFLLKNRIALWDVIAFAERKGSLDSAIKNEVPNRISKLLEEHPGIEKILLNGTAAEKYFRKYFKDILDSMECVRVPSTSPIPGRNIKSLNDKLVEWKNALDMNKPNEQMGLKSKKDSTK